MNINECLDLIALESVDTNFKVIIHTLAVWLDENYQAASNRFDKAFTLDAFESRVEWTTRTGQYQRKVLSQEYALPSALVSWEVAREKAEQILGFLRKLPLEDRVNFLADLTGAWILTCPEVFIRQHDATINRERYEIKSDADLISLMIKWLHYSLGLSK